MDDLFSRLEVAEKAYSAVQDRRKQFEEYFKHLVKTDSESIPVYQLCFSGFAFNDWLDHPKWTPLAHAAAHGAEGVVKALLNTPGINVNHRDELGRVPLHCSITGRITLRLLDAGGDVNARDSIGQTALSFCVCSQMAREIDDMVLYLLNYRAFPDAPTEWAVAHYNVHTPLSIALNLQVRNDALNSLLALTGGVQLPSMWPLINTLIRFDADPERVEWLEELGDTTLVKLLFEKRVASSLIFPWSKSLHAQLNISRSACEMLQAFICCNGRMPNPLPRELFFYIFEFLRRKDFLKRAFSIEEDCIKWLK
eukprot:m.42609 g.42609  ORF g.42609 m.42609 type:complete len:310 (+) comp17023_c0_seq4:152-1081(+)